MLGAERFDDAFGVAGRDAADDQATARFENALHLLRVVRDGFGVDVGEDDVGPVGLDRPERAGEEADLRGHVGAGGDDGVVVNIAAVNNGGTELKGGEGEDAGAGAKVEDAVAGLDGPFENFEGKLRGGVGTGAESYAGVDDDAKAAGGRGFLAPRRGDEEAFADGASGPGGFRFGLPIGIGLFGPVGVKGGKFGGVEGLFEKRSEGDSAGGEVVLGDARGIEFPETAEEFVLFVLGAIEGERVH